MARQKIYATDADRVKAHRERNKVKTLCVEIPDELHAQLEEYLKFKDISKSAVIIKLLKNQLLRKR